MNSRRIVVSGGILILIAATIQAWAQRFYIHPDSLQYLDIASAYARGDFKSAINATWSPLTSWLYIPFVLIVPRSAEWAFYHLLNVVILAGSYLVWLKFVRAAAARAGMTLRAPQAMFLIAVFAWVELKLIPMHFIGGDRPGVMLFLWGVALLLQEDRPSYAGVLLGLAYLAKAVFLPVAIITLTAFALLRFRPRQIALAAITCGLVAAPWITTLSLTKHRFTYSDAGRVNYLFDVNSIPPVHYRSPELTHPVQVINQDPLIVGYEAPFHATYNSHYDVGYWYEGATSRPDFAGVLRQAGRNVVVTLKIIAPLLALGLLTLLLAQKRQQSRTALLLTVVAVAGTGMLCTLHIEPRYIAPFILLLAAAVAVSVEFAANLKRSAAVILIVAILLGNYLLYSTALDLLSIFGYDRRYAEWRDNPAVVDALKAHGMGEGDRLAQIGYDFFMHNARVVGARVVASTPARDTSFWAAPVAKQEAAIEAMRRAGIKAVITSHQDPRWQPLAGRFFIRPLR